MRLSPLKCLLLLALVIAGCAGVSATHPQNAGTDAKALAATQAIIRAHSDNVLNAFDRGDVPGFEALLDQHFLHFEGGKPTDRPTELAQLSKRAADASRIGDRKWTEQYIHLQDQTATYVGKAIERQAGNDIHGAYTYEGWYTLTWVNRPRGWKLLLWTWQPAGIAAERDQWNAIYRNSVGFNKQPNQLLVDTVTKRTPGTALDVAQGEGRNSLWLAQQGWQVTGVDFSDEGLRVAQGRAEQLKVRLTTINADLAQFDFGEAQWDLVTMIYASDDRSWLQKIKRSIKPGGTLVVEFFHGDDSPGEIDGKFARGELAKLFADEFDIVRDDVVQAVPDWAMDRASLVRFVATRKSR